jgi:threonine dehydratase
MPATAQYPWPLLAERLGCTVWVKHENHTPTGAFKVRGGITFMHWLKRTHPGVRGIATATRGNHGQSLALAASAQGLNSLIVVPQGNSLEKNNAMRGFGGEVVEHGRDFDEAREEAARLAQVHGLYLVPPFHTELVKGVATYALELFKAAPDLDTVYVPIGCGSGICAVIAARDALGLKTQVVGVVSTEAAAAKLSFETGALCETASADTFADGLAVRKPIAEAFAVYAAGAARIVSVNEAQIAEAMCMYYTDTHNLAEGAGAAALAALIQERDAMRGKRVGVILSGGNVDRSVYARVIG